MFESLTRFIPLLEDEESHGEWIVDHTHKGTHGDPKFLPYVEYGKTADNLFDAIWDFGDDHPELDLRNYSDIMDRNLPKDRTSLGSVDASQLDGQTIMAILYGAVRSERFIEGLFLGFLEDGCIRRWLTRLREIDEQNAAS